MENSDCNCVGLRYCKYCADTERVRTVLEAARAQGQEIVEALFEKNKDATQSQSSCSFASLPPKSPFTLCSCCGKVFDLLEGPLDPLLGCFAHVDQHPTEDGVELRGLFTYPDAVDEAEEKRLVDFLDTPNDRFPGWKTSQSGRRKQDFGPQANFKKRKLKLRSDVPGVPIELKGLYAKLASLVPESTPLTESSEALPVPYVIVESSALEYSPDNCSNLDPHIDDTWVWGPRVAGISLLSGCVMTFVSAKGEQVDVVLPRRWAFLLSGSSRYDWLHGIRTTGVVGRRVSITMRELEPSAALEDGLQDAVLKFAHTFV